MVSFDLVLVQATACMMCLIVSSSSHDCLVAGCFSSYRPIVQCQSMATSVRATTRAADREVIGSSWLMSRISGRVPRVVVYYYPLMPQQFRCARGVSAGGERIDIFSDCGLALPLTSQRWPASLAGTGRDKACRPCRSLNTCV